TDVAGPALRFRRSALWYAGRTGARAAVTRTLRTAMTAAAIALLGALLALERDASEDLDERAEEARSAFRSLRTGVLHDAARVDAEVRAAEQRIRALSAELSRMQSVVVRLDALARRLVANAQLD